MIIKPAVFDGNERLTDIIGQITYFDRIAIPVAIGGKCCTIDTDDPDRWFAFAGDIKTDFVGQPVSVIGHDTTAKHHDPDAAKDDETCNGLWPGDQIAHARK